MALTKFKLVGHEKLKGLYYKGNLIPFEQLDDTMAEQLVGKTHVLERVGEAPQSVAVAEATSAEETPATGSRRKN